MPPRHATPADTAAAVDAFLATLQHPHRDAIQRLRRVITGADPAIAEGIKWNAPSCRADEYFATTHLRAKDGVMLILHRGAKLRAQPDGRAAIADPAGLLSWLGDDRASVTFRDDADVAAKAPALQAVVRQWLAAEHSSQAP